MFAVEKIQRISAFKIELHRSTTGETFEPARQIRGMLNRVSCFLFVLHNEKLVFFVLFNISLALPTTIIMKTAAVALYAHTRTQCLSGKYVILFLLEL